MVYDKVVSGPAYLKNKLRSLDKNIKFKNNKTYIIPTGFGWAFGSMCLVTLSMAIGFGNNLLYFFVFLLISIALTGARLTNKNVDAFRVIDMEGVHIFANEANTLSIVATCAQPDVIVWDLYVQASRSLVAEVGPSPWPGGPATRQNQRGRAAGAGTPTFTKVSSAPTRSSLTWTPLIRGRQAWPRTLIQSRFPFGMLRAWKYHEKSVEIIVYPQRKGQGEIPGADGRQAQDSPSLAESYGIFRDHREFETSDSPRRIDWKKSVKHQKHFVKNFDASGEKKILIEWNMTNAIPHFEDKVSQLALWIDLCHVRGDLYSLKIKDEQTAYANQISHYKDCMTQLALISPDDFA